MRRIDRGSLLLALGSATGLLVAAAGLLASGRSSGGGLGPDLVARVNDVGIRADDYQRALAGVATDRRDLPDAAMRRHVLDRLIDEELLVQRGLSLGLARVDARVRRELAAAVIASAVTEHDNDAPPPRTELAAFYDAEGAFFARTDRLHVRQVWIAGSSPDAAAHAQEAAARLRAGEDLAAVRAALGDPELAPLPDAPLPPNKLADYLGPTALQTASRLAPGAVSDPVRSASGWHVLVVVARQTAERPPLAEVMEQVRAEWQRRQGENALRAYLSELRAEADIEVGDIR